MKKFLFIIIVTLFCNSSFSQKYTVKGYVYDEYLAPFKGAKVTLKGTTNITTTDKKGFFQLEIDGIHSELIFESNGFERLVYKVERNDRDKDISVILKESSALNDIVVSSSRTPAKRIKRSLSKLFKKKRRKIRRPKAIKSRRPNAKYNKFRSKSVSACSKARKSYPQASRKSETYSKIEENSFKDVSKNALSTFSVDVDRASYSNIRRFINTGGLPPVDAVRIEEMINYFTYEYKKPKGETPFSINSELGTCPWNKDNLLLHIGLQGKQIELDKLPPSNIVFLLDVSGSMGDSNKLPLLKSSLKLLLEKLRPQDKVAIVVYAGSSGIVLPSTNCDKKKKIIEALEKLYAGGSTAGGEGLKLAYKVAKENFIKEGNNRIILATDGDFNVGVRNEGGIERYIETKRDSGIAISVLGFGMGNYRDNIVETIANKGNGNYAYIDNLLEAKKVLVNEFGGTLFTIAKDVKFQLEFNPKFVKKYRLIGYENRKLENEDFEDDKKDAGEIGAGHRVTALYEIIPANNKVVKSALKYQTANLSAQGEKSNEIATIKLRYKKPKESKSILVDDVVAFSPKELSKTSTNFRFSAAVVQFGMLLRDSKFKGNTTWESARKLAKKSRGKDDEGYRAEMVRLMESARLLNESKK